MGEQKGMWEPTFSIRAAIFFPQIFAHSHPHCNSLKLTTDWSQGYLERFGLVFAKPAFVLDPEYLYMENIICYGIITYLMTKISHHPFNSLRLDIED